jgi:hypothetical protein
MAADIVLLSHFRRGDAGPAKFDITSPTDIIRNVARPASQRLGRVLERDRFLVATTSNRNAPIARNLAMDLIE